MHREDTVKNRFHQLFRTAMLKRSNNVIARNIEYLKETVARSPPPSYKNVHLIEEYIDEYWFVNCPAHLSIFQ